MTVSSAIGQSNKFLIGGNPTLFSLYEAEKPRVVLLFLLRKEAISKIAQQIFLHRQKKTDHSSRPGSIVHAGGKIKIKNILFSIQDAALKPNLMKIIIQFYPCTSPLKIDFPPPSSKLDHQYGEISPSIRNFTCRSSTPTPTSITKIWHVFSSFSFIIYFAELSSASASSSSISLLLYPRGSNWIGHSCSFILNLITCSC